MIVALILFSRMRIFLPCKKMHFMKLEKQAEHFMVGNLYYMHNRNHFSRVLSINIIACPRGHPYFVGGVRLITYTVTIYI